MSEAFEERVRTYWEDPATVSIIDKNLHELEIRTVSRYLLSTDTLADVGCGDGEATVRYARKVVTAVGIERSNTLRARAEEAARREGLSNTRFVPGDVLGLDVHAEYDVAVSQRLLINLSSWDQQQMAIMNIHRALRPGGRFIMVENTNEGFQAMNDVRVALGMDPVPQHWHNRFFGHDELTAFLRGKFQVLRHIDFGLYYLLTRCYVPMFASFVGYGPKAVKDPIYERSDTAALRLFELMEDRLSIDVSPAFGPIQAWVLRREGTE